MMRSFLATVPHGTYHAEDFLDDDGVEDKPVRIAVPFESARGGRKSVSSKQPPAITIDFTGSDPQVRERSMR